MPAVEGDRRAGCGQTARPVVRPAKAGAFSGRQSHRGKSQTPRSLDGRGAGNPTPKAHRQRHPWDGKRVTGPYRKGTQRWPRKCEAPEAEPATGGRRPHGPSQAGWRDGPLRRGGSDSTVTRTRRATGETVLVPARKRWSKVDRITGAPGKAVEGETVAEGSGVARKAGNAARAKGPYCSCSFEIREAGVP